MRRLTSKDYRRMPWRNRRGTTTELVVIELDSAGLFLARVSIADVQASGPFSRFDGYDRHILMLDGAGMTLDCGAHGMVVLDAPRVPRAFSGDWDVYGTLVSGPVRDFNLIVDRARARASLAVHELDRDLAVGIAPGACAIAYVLEGSLDGADPGDTLVADAAFELRPRGTARVVLAVIAPSSS